MNRVGGLEHALQNTGVFSEPPSQRVDTHCREGEDLVFSSTKSCFDAIQMPAVDTASGSSVHRQELPVSDSFAVPLDSEHYSIR